MKCFLAVSCIHWCLTPKGRNMSEGKGSFVEIAWSSEHTISYLTIMADYKWDKIKALRIKLIKCQNIYDLTFKCIPKTDSLRQKYSHSNLPTQSDRIKERHTRCTRGGYNSGSSIHSTFQPLAKQTINTRRYSAN